MSHVRRDRWGCRGRRNQPPLSCHCCDQNTSQRKCLSSTGLPPETPSMCRLLGSGSGPGMSQQIFLLSQSPGLEITDPRIAKGKNTPHFILHKINAQLYSLTVLKLLKNFILSSGQCGGRHPSCSIAAS